MSDPTPESAPESLAERLEQIEARLSKATPAPWSAGKNSRLVRWVRMDGENRLTSYVAECLVSGGYVENAPGNAEFIAHAREDIPFLIAALRAPASTPAARWREEGKPDPHGSRYDRERAMLCGGQMTDDELANAVYLEPDIANLAAAKDRIRWLSRKLQAALRSNPEIGRLFRAAYSALRIARNSNGWKQERDTLVAEMEPLLNEARQIEARIDPGIAALRSNPAPAETVAGSQEPESLAKLKQALSKFHRDACYPNAMGFEIEEAAFSILAALRTDTRASAVEALRAARETFVNIANRETVRTLDQFYDAFFDIRFVCRAAGSRIDAALSKIDGGGNG